MFTIIGGDGQEYGPVSTEQMQAWMSAGRADRNTRARRDGETEWKTLGDFSEFSGSTQPPPVYTGTGEAAGSSKEPIKVDSKAYSAELIARADKLDVFEVLRAAFDLWTKNFWPLVGVTAVVYLVIIVGNMIPFIGSLVGFVLNGVFLGGLFYYYIGKLRGEPREFGDGFAGFKRSTAQLIVNGIVSSLITGLLLLPILVPVFIGIGITASQHGGGTPSPSTLAILVGVSFLCLLPVIYISICWQFSHALIIDRNMGFWDALMITRRVVTKQWWRVFFICILASIVAMLGIIGLGIGLLLTLPIAFAAITIVYERLFNPAPRT